MIYDHWKTTNPDDQWLGPDPDEETEMKGWENQFWKMLSPKTAEALKTELGLTPSDKAELVRDNMLTEAEKAFIREAVERKRPEIEADMAQPQDYTQNGEDVMLIQYALALAMQDLLKREAMYANGGGWCLGRVHADIARCHKLQDKYGRCFETVMRDCGE